MKKKFVYRKLKYNQKDYYQLYKIVDIDEDLNIKDTKPGVSVEEFYQTDVQVDNKNSINEILYTYYHLEDDEILLESNPVIIHKLHQKFYEKFKDFDYIPKNSFDVLELEKICNEKVLFQEKSISDALNIIKSNLDILDSDISEEQKERLKHNILIYGPSGFGKKSFIDAIMNNTSVPSVTIELGNNPDKNLQHLVNGLGVSSFFNLKKAEHGIVFIRDNFDMILSEQSSDDENVNPYELVELLMMNKRVTLGSNQEVDFDLSKLTYVLLIDTPSNNPENLYDSGMSQYLYDQFQEIVCFNRLEIEQIKEIILSNPENPLNIYKKICTGIGKKLIIEDDFLEYLIKKAYYGIGGITLINNYIEAMIKVRWNNKEIVLDKEAVDNEVSDTTYLQDWITEQEEKNINNEKEEIEDIDNNVSNKEDSDNEEFKLDIAKVRNDFREKLPNLMKYIKGQDEPLRNILFYSIVNDSFQNSNLSRDMKKERIKHMLIRGGPGTGKSFITGLVSKSLNNKPYTVVDCKRFSQTGYVGKSVDDILIQLYHIAGGDLEKAQKGIVVLDEFDKLARVEGSKEDVSRGAVQESLLKMLEGAVFDLEIKENGYGKIINFDTRETSFIGAGAFEGLDKIRDARLKKNTKKSTIGFQSEIKKEENIIADTGFTVEDMKEFGMDAQLLRRMNYHCDLNKLDKESYKDIMLNSKSSSFKIECELVESFGVKVTYDEEFVNEFVEVVSRLGYGASSISILTEKIFSSFLTKLLDKDYEEVILTKECVHNPSKVILVEEQKDEKVLKKQI